MAGTRVIGVDLGGTKISAGLVDEDGTVERTLERPTPLDSQEALLAAIVEMVRELKERRRRGGRDRRPGARRPALPEPCSAPSTSRSTTSTSAPRCANGSGLPVTVDNDASAAALAEHRVGRGPGRERARRC